jgi:hypothetical protein
MIKNILELALVSLIASLVGCQGPNDWNITQYEETGVVPDPGVWYISKPGCFQVEPTIGIQNSVLDFSVDCVRFDKITIYSGVFYNLWGTADGSSCPSCSCPTDGYAISGHFTSPTNAEGSIIYGACNYNFPLTQFSFEASLP